MLIMKTRTRAPLHGYGIAQSIKRVSNDVLTETNRRARYYTLTAAGRKQLGIELSKFQNMIAAIGRVLDDAQEAV
jgi:PadR family transcriptional regulator, regulatory protein PadR